MKHIRLILPFFLISIALSSPSKSQTLSEHRQAMSVRDDGLIDKELENIDEKITYHRNLGHCHYKVLENALTLYKLEGRIDRLTAEANDNGVEIRAKVFNWEEHMHRKKEGTDGYALSYYKRATTKIKPFLITTVRTL